MLIIGTGFNRQIGVRDCSPLVCWSSLLRHVENNLEVNLPSIDWRRPTLVWESLITACITKESHNGNSKPANQVESKLRGYVQNTLKAGENSFLETRKKENTPEPQGQSNLYQRLQAISGHVLNLNFDRIFEESCLGSHESIHSSKVKQVPLLNRGRKTDHENIYSRNCIGPTKGQPRLTVWHPHGDLHRNKASIRLGLRDYGIISAVYAEAFAKFKQWELKVTKKSPNEPWTDAQIQELTKEKSQWDIVPNDKQGAPGTFNYADNWITRFMLEPLTFIGVGLSQEEIGLHWLLTQRQRNWARVAESKRAKAKWLFVSDNSEWTPHLRQEKFACWNKAWMQALESNNV